MPSFSTTKAAKAWREHEKDLVEITKLTTATVKYKTVAEKIDASQAKVLNGELLKMSKAVAKALEGIGKQQQAIALKQQAIDDLERHQHEISKELKELAADNEMDAKKRAIAVKKNEVMMAVGEIAGGWGVKARFENMDGLTIK